MQKFTESSMTQQKMHYSIPQLVARHEAGHLPGIGRDAEYYNEEDVPLHRQVGIDIVDITRGIISSKSELSSLEERQKLIEDTVERITSMNKEIAVLELKADSDKPLTAKERRTLKKLYHEYDELTTSINP